MYNPLSFVQRCHKELISGDQKKKIGDGMESQYGQRGYKYLCMQGGWASQRGNNGNGAKRNRKVNNKTHMRLPSRSRKLFPFYKLNGGTDEPVKLVLWTEARLRDFMFG